MPSLFLFVISNIYICKFAKELTSHGIVMMQIVGQSAAACHNVC